MSNSFYLSVISASLQFLLEVMEIVFKVYCDFVEVSADVVFSCFTEMNQLKDVFMFEMLSVSA